MKILWIQTSPRGESQSTKLAEALVEKIKNQHENSMVTIENLSKSPPSHLTDLHLRSFFTAKEHLTEVQKESLKQSDYYINQLQAHECIVISFPVWNFSVPSSLKAWIDQIVRVGMTFRYIDSKPQGLIEKRKVFLVSARGGIYPENFSNVANGPFDFSSLLMRTVLGYIGLHDITELRIDGLAIPGIKESALEKAFSELKQLNQ